MKTTSTVPICITADGRVISPSSRIALANPRPEFGEPTETQTPPPLPGAGAVTTTGTPGAAVTGGGLPPSPAPPGDPDNALKSAELAAQKAQAAQDAVAKAKAALDRAKAEADAAKREAEGKTTEVDAWLSRLKETHAESEKLRNQLAEREARHQRDSRIKYLREAGALPNLTDAQLLQLAPDVDVETDGGRSSIETWRENNSGLFTGKVKSTKAVVDGLLQTLPDTSKDPRLDEIKRAIIAKNFGGN